MDTFKFAAETRNDRGKGASRRLRRDGKIPGILYGAGNDPVAIQLGHNDMLLHTDHEAFYSHILTLTLDGRPEPVVLKDMQRHVYKRAILHMDFQRVSETEELSMRVPIHFLNEEKCIGVKQHGGVISHLMSDLEIKCLPKDLPESIEVDVQAMDLGDTIHLSELNIPQGVTLDLLSGGSDDDLPVVSVHLPRVVEEDVEADEAEAEASAAAAASGEEAKAEDEGGDEGDDD